MQFHNRQSFGLLWKLGTKISVWSKNNRISNSLESNWWWIFCLMNSKNFHRKFRSLLWWIWLGHWCQLFLPTLTWINSLVWSCASSHSFISWKHLTIASTSSSLKIMKIGSYVLLLIISLSLFIELRMFSNENKMLQQF